MSPSKLRLAGILAAASVLLAGCGLNLAGPDQLGVDLVHSNVTFGAAKPTPPGPPALGAGLGTPPPPPFLSFDNFDFNLASFAPCPAASPGAAPVRPTSFFVTSRPQMGAYRFQLGGAYIAQVLTFTFKIPLVGFWNEYVRNVADMPGTQTPTGNNYTQGFQFETVEPNPKGGYFDLHWQVRKTPLRATVNPPGAVVNDPQGGLVLTQVDTLDGKFKNPHTIFKPTGAGILFAPVPVQPGSSWTSAAADPTTPMTLQGSVIGKARLDACGQLIDGFEIKATVTSGSSQATLDYIVAPQYGMLIVSRKIDGTYLGIQWSKANVRRGQVDADPLPSGLAS